MKIDVNNIAKNLNTPLTAPAYPMPPYKFVNREYLNIIYRTDEKALRAYSYQNLSKLLNHWLNSK